MNPPARTSSTMGWDCCCAPEPEDNPIPAHTDAEVLYGLIDRLQEVQDVEIIIDTINIFAELKLELVLETMQNYLQTEKKISSMHRMILYNIMLDNIQRDTAANIGEARAASLIQMAYVDMNHDKVLVNDYQRVARNILIALERRFPDLVFTVLVNSFRPGVLPHRNVLLTIANLSSDNDVSRIIYQYQIMERLTGVIRLVLEDSLKTAMCQVILKFSIGALKYFKAVKIADEEPVISEETTEKYIYEAFEVLFYNWLGNTTLEGKRIILKTVGIMSFLIAQSTFEEHFPCIIQRLISQYRSNVQPRFISQCMNNVLNVITNNGTKTLEYKSWPVILQLFSQACKKADGRPLETMMRSVIRKNFGILATYLLESSLKVFSEGAVIAEETECITAIYIIKAVISHDIVDIEKHKYRIMNAVVITMNTQSTKVTEGPLGLLISYMAYHGFIDDDRGWLLVEYIVRHCASNTTCFPNDDIKDYECDLQNACLTSLQYLGSTYTGRTNILWAQLLSYVCSPEYNTAMIPVCNALARLTVRKQAGGLAHFLVEVNKSGIPTPQTLLARILTISSSLKAEGAHANVALALLHTISPVIHNNIASLWNEEMANLKANGDMMESDWENQLLQFFVKTMKAIKSEKWSGKLIQEIKMQLIISAEHPLEKAFLYKLLGATIQAVSNEIFVRTQLSLLLQESDHEEDVEREGVAYGFGLASKEHLESALSVLNDFGITEVWRSSSFKIRLMQGSWQGWGNWQKKACTVMLALGHIAVQAKHREVIGRTEGMLQTILTHFSPGSEEAYLKLSFAKSVAMLTSVMTTSGEETLKPHQKEKILKLMKCQSRRCYSDHRQCAFLETDIRIEAVKD
ncbi:maestro heat-like repeat-containing protein family member 1 isoform X2 [Ambystoma mexicanum]|uniref:maestro heat-like repeat-containing protein family member 1 isoform X2 n=1 Tax=Ambystoma mexicanum TaxID=8296 RepID=UPI0037E894EB